MTRRYRWSTEPDFDSLPDVVADPDPQPVQRAEGVPMCPTCRNDPESCGCAANERWERE